MRAIFSISHPMQYINAIEARHARGLTSTECALLIFNKPFHLQRQRLDAIINPEEWGTVRFIPYPRFWMPPGPLRNRAARLRMNISKVTSARGFVREIETVLAGFGNPEIMAIGNYVSRPHRHLLAAAQRRDLKEIILLDEGVATPAQIAPARFNPETPVSRIPDKRFTRRDLSGRILSTLTGLRYDHPESVTFFTMYDINVPPHDRVERNTFDHLRQQVRDFRSSDELWFVGTADVERNVARREAYLALIDRVRGDFPHSRLIYLPHRYESPEKLEKIETAGFSVIRSGMAIEPWLLVHGKLPEKIVSVASTAIDTLSRILDGKVTIRIYHPGGEYFTGTDGRTRVETLIDCHRRNNSGNIEIVDMKTHYNK